MNIHHKDPQGLQAAVEEGCFICSIFWDQASDKLRESWESSSADDWESLQYCLYIENIDDENPVKMMLNYTSSDPTMSQSVRFLMLPVDGKLVGMQSCYYHLTHVPRSQIQIHVYLPRSCF
jgi:hypothetical protein